MRESFQNLFFAVIGGVIVAAVSYFFFSDSETPIEYATVSHGYTNIVNPDSVLDSLSFRQFFEYSETLENGDPKFENINEIYDSFQDIDIFQNLKFVSIHTFEISNQTSTVINDIVLRPNFEFFSYYIGNINNEFFKALPNSENFSISPLHPNDKVFVVGFDKHFSWRSFDDQSDYLSISQGGKSLTVHRNYVAEDMLPAIRLIEKNPFLSFSIFSLLCVFSMVFLMMVVIDLTAKFYPEITVKFMSRADRDRLTKLVERFDKREQQQK